MQVSLHTDNSLFEALNANEWNELVRCSQADTIFSTWEWHYYWWHAYQPGEIFALVIRDNDQLVAIAPMFIEQDAELGRTLRIIGSVDVTDYLDVIVSQQNQAQIYETLAQALIDHQNHYDVLDFCNIPAESPTYTHFQKVLENHGFTVSTEQQEVCPTITLPDNFETYVESLEGKQRSELRRKLRKAEGSGSMAWYIVGEQHDLNAELERFLKLMTTSHPAKARFLENPQHVAFFKAFMPIAFAKGWLQLNFETADDDAVATYLNFDYNNDILVYNSGLEPNKFGALSPGIVLLANNIQYAIEQKKRHFNFLRGNETYKYLMGAQDTIIYNIKARVL
jgi:CelD/BcsL family acetyltransferase involved in cellulose biosynthesis